MGGLFVLSTYTRGGVWTGSPRKKDTFVARKGCQGFQRVIQEGSGLLLGISPVRSWSPFCCPRYSWTFTNAYEKGHNISSKPIDDWPASSRAHFFHPSVVFRWHAYSHQGTSSQQCGLWLLRALEIRFWSRCGISNIDDVFTKFFDQQRNILFFCITSLFTTVKYFSSQFTL